MFPRYFALAFILLTQISPAADPFGKVELSLNQWQETMDRLTKAETLKNTPVPKEAAAPCVAIVSSANCEISYLKDQLRLTTDFEIEVLSDQWTLLPLADAALPLLSSQTSEGRILVKDGAYVLLTNKPGKIKVRLIQEQQASEKLDFWLAPATSTQTHLATVDPDLHWTLNDKILTSEPIALAANETGKTSFQLRRTTAPVIEKPDLTPGIWQSRSETQVSYEDGRLNYQSRVVLLCTGGNNATANLTIPAESIVLGVEGGDLDKWTAEKTNLQLTWKKADARQRVVLVNFAITLPNIVGQWPLISPKSPDQQPQSEVWQLTTPIGLRQTLPKEQPLIASLSVWMRAKLAENDTTAFQAISGSQIEVTALKTVALAQARVESAKFSSELAVGGGMLTDARLEIVTSEKTTVDLQFEKDARIISCRVAGQRQNPVDLGEGRIQVSLPATRENVTVELTFSQQLPAFNPASGQVRLTMPLTPLLTKSANWSVKLPPDLALNAFDGSVTADSTGGNGELRFHQELYRDTAPLVVLFYQKKIK